MSSWQDGPVEAPAIVFVHGATADHRSWDPQVAELCDRFRTVTVDLAGHGASGSVPFSFEAAVADLQDLLDRLSGPVALVGLSLGGAVAQEVVYRDPGLVDALVVADSTCMTGPRAPLEKPLAIAALSATALVPRAVFRRRAAAAMTTDPDVAGEVRAELAGWSPLDAVEVLTELVAALHPDPTYRLPVPTLLLHGDRDCLGDIAAGMRAWARRDPRAEYAAVPDAGHISNRDNPRAFTTELRSFVDRALSPDDDVRRDQQPQSDGRIEARGVRDDRYRTD